MRSLTLDLPSPFLLLITLTPTGKKLVQL
uniref:Uncharacterized protein n=1 Tax=Megaselia scalaris TaxID=36166 RepID=T1GSW6_MEGSC